MISTILYWLYISLFIFLVLVPHFVREGYFFSSLGQEVTEMFLLFIIGIIQLILYNWTDTQAKKFSKERFEYFKKISETSKDLTSLYTYIGALNRKIEILRNIILRAPQKALSQQKEQRSSYAFILNAIKLFGDCDEVTLGFYKKDTKEICIEISSRVGFKLGTEKGRCFLENEKEYVKCGEYCVIRSKQRMHNIAAYCTFKKNYIDDQDVELIKATLVQGIFLFLSLRGKKENI